MAVPTPFLQEIRRLREANPNYNTIKTMGAALGIGETHYGKIELNLSPALPGYAEAMLALLVPPGEGREEELTRLRSLPGYDANTDHVLDIVTGIKRSSRPGLDTMLSSVRVLSNIPVRTLADRTGISLNTLGNLLVSPDRQHTLSETLTIVENGFGIERDAGDKTGFTAIRKLYEQSVEAMRVLDEYKPKFGKALYAHRKYNEMAGSTSLPQRGMEQLMHHYLSTDSKLDAAISSIETGNSQVSVSWLMDFVTMFNTFRAAKTEHIGRNTYRAAELPEDMLADLRDRYHTPFDPSHLSFKEFIQSGEALAQRFPILQKSYTPDHPDAVAFSNNMNTIRGFLNLSKTAVHASITASTVKRRKSPLPADTQQEIFANLGLDNRDSFDATAESMRRVMEFHKRYLVETSRIQKNVEGLQSRAVTETTGTVASQHLARHPNGIRKLAVWENRADKQHIIAVSKAMREGDDESVAAVDADQRQWIEKIISTPSERPQAAPEIVMYDRRAAREGQEIFAKEWATVRGDFERAYDCYDRQRRQREGKTTLSV